MEQPISPASEKTHLLKMLESIGVLSDAEREAILQLPSRTRVVAAGQDIVRDGDAPVECCVILSGLACRYKALRGGLRQIMSFQIPGDMPDLQSLKLGRMDHSIGALQSTRAAFIPYADIKDLLRRFPPLSDLFWKSTLVEAAIFREWMVGMGRRSATARIAHLFCEVRTRMQQNGATVSEPMVFPVTQADLSDAMGLSAVHVNRVMKTLKLTYGVSLKAGRLVSSDWAGLASSCDFDPSYLHRYEAASPQPPPR